ncbi:MAG: hypothetical protein RI932_1578 [Pseudomonadota bacterium]|jgi:hypothetical protein
MNKYRSFNRSAAWSVLAVAGLSVFVGRAIADTIPRPLPNPNLPVRPPILIDPAKLPVIRHSYLLKTAPIRIVSPIQTRLPKLPLPQLRPETLVTIGNFNDRGDVDGSKNMSLSEIQNAMNTWAAEQRSEYQIFAGRSPIFANMAFKEFNQQSPTKNRNVRVGQIPMDLAHLQALKYQSDAFKNPGQVEDTPQFKDRSAEFSGGYARTMGNEYFGVDANAGYGVKVNKDNQRADANLTVSGTLLKENISVFDAQAHNATGENSYAYVSVFGQKVWEATSPSFSGDKGFDRSEGARARFWLGPVPLSVGGSVGGRLGAQYDIRGLVGEKLVTGLVRPYLDTYGNVDAAIDAYVASAGVFGSLKFLGVSIPVDANVKYDIAATEPKLTAELGVNTNFDALSGRVGLFAEIDYWLDSERWEKTLFSWSGFQESLAIFNQRESLPLRDYIGWKYRQLNGASGFLGAPRSPESQTPATRPGLYRHYNGGSIYWSENTGAHVVLGLIRDKWAAKGWEQGELGFPTSDELTAPDGQGKYSHFEGGSLWYHPATGNAFLVKGKIYQKWAALRRGMGNLGYPITDELTTPNGRGRYNHFQNGSIYWTPEHGAFEVRGLIRNKWAEAQWERGVLGFPVTDESQTPDGVGRFNHFEGGSVYYHPEFGTWIVRGSARDRWQSLNWERGCLGYPKADQRITESRSTTVNMPGLGNVPGVISTYVQEFEGGSVTYKQECGPGICRELNVSHQCTLAPIKLPPRVNLPVVRIPMPLPRPIPPVNPNSFDFDSGSNAVLAEDFE